MNYADIIWKLVEKLLNEQEHKENSTEDQDIKDKAED